MNRYDTETQMIQPIPPQQLPSGMDAPVNIPRQQAVWSGVFAGLAVIMPTMIVGLAVGWVGGFATGQRLITFGWVVGWIIAALFMALTVASLVAWQSWNALRPKWQQIIEDVLLAFKFQYDIDGDGQYGTQPALPEPPLEVRYVDNQGQINGYGYLPHQKELRSMAQALLNDQTTFSEASFAKLLKRDDFIELRDEMMKRGLVVWRDPNNHPAGMWITAKGRATLKGLAEQGLMNDLDGNPRWQNMNPPPQADEY